MKTVEEILKRDDYARLTSSLAERVESIAKRIRIKMDELNIPQDPDYGNGEIQVGNVIIRISKVRSNGCGSYRFLSIYCGEDGYRSLEDINDGYYYAGDFSAWVSGATNKDALKFLNAAKQIIDALDNIETNQVKEVKKALADTENI